MSSAIYDMQEKLNLHPVKKECDGFNMPTYNTLYDGIVQSLRRTLRREVEND